ncbi:hypothetical protein ACI65C_005561 [Semiaphis heraclei]
MTKMKTPASLTLKPLSHRRYLICEKQRNKKINEHCPPTTIIEIHDPENRIRLQPGGHNPGAVESDIVLIDILEKSRWRRVTTLGAILLYLIAMFHEELRTVTYVGCDETLKTTPKQFRRGSLMTFQIVYKNVKNVLRDQPSRGECAVNSVLLCCSSAAETTRIHISNLYTGTCVEFEFTIK